MTARDVLATNQFYYQLPTLIALAVLGVAFVLRRSSLLSVSFGVLMVAIAAGELRFPFGGKTLLLVIGALAGYYGGVIDIVAIVGAYHYSTALAGFNTFSSRFGLPTQGGGSATSSSNRYFQVVYASGKQAPALEQVLHVTRGISPHDLPQRRDHPVARFDALVVRL